MGQAFGAKNSSHETGGFRRAGKNQWEIFRIRINGGTLVPDVWPYFVGIFPEI